MSGVIHSARKRLGKVSRGKSAAFVARTAFYADLIRLFEDYDCDTLYECVGADPAFDEAFSRLYPPEDDDDSS